MRRKLLVLLIAILTCMTVAFTVTACGGDENEYVAVTGVTVADSSEGSSSTIYNGSWTKNTVDLSATVAPADATNKQVGFTSSDTSVATVNYDSGLVTARGAGTATITATAKADTAKTATYTVTVVNNTLTLAVTTAPTKTSYVEGQRFDYTGMVVTGTYADGTGGVFHIDGLAIENPVLAVATNAISIRRDTAFGAVRCTTPVTVVAKAIASIEVTTLPTKTFYIAGETFDAAGMVVTATYNDASTKVLSANEYSVDTTTALVDGAITAAVSLVGNTAITCNAAIKVVDYSSISITRGPAYTTYTDAEVIAPSDIEVSLKYTDNSSVVLDSSLYTISALAIGANPVVSFTTVPAMTATISGLTILDGLDDNNYRLIYDARMFADFLNDGSYNAILARDINLKGITFTERETANSLTAILDGGNFKVSNFYGEVSTGKRSAFFDTLAGTIKNITFENVEVINGVDGQGSSVNFLSYTIGATATLDNVIFKNVSIESTYSSEGYSGIVAGRLTNDSVVTINNCKFINCSVANTKYVGGLIGDAGNGKTLALTISNTEIEISVTAGNFNEDTGEIAYNQCAGAIVGRSRSASAVYVFNNVKIDATVIATKNVGGLFGEYTTADGNSFTDVLFVGLDLQATDSDSVNVACGKTNDAKFDAIEYYSDAGLIVAADAFEITFGVGDAEAATAKTWQGTAVSKYPATIVEGEDEAAITWNMIYTPAQLKAWLDAANGKNARLFKDIDMKSIDMGAGSAPQASGFIFDGAGFTVKNLNVSDDAATGALFSSCFDCEFKNVTFKDCSITSAAGYVGFIAKETYSTAKFTNVNFVNIEVTSTGTTGFAGILGASLTNHNGTICAVTDVTVTGSTVTAAKDVGGLFGRIQADAGLAISNLDLAVTINGYTVAETVYTYGKECGGIAGILMGANTFTVANSIFDVTILGGYDCGAIFGYSSAATPVITLTDVTLQSVYIDSMYNGAGYANLATGRLNGATADFSGVTYYSDGAKYGEYNLSVRYGASLDNMTTVLATAYQACTAVELYPATKVVDGVTYAMIYSAEELMAFNQGTEVVVTPGYWEPIAVPVAPSGTESGAVSGSVQQSGTSDPATQGTVNVLDPAALAVADPAIAVNADTDLGYFKLHAASKAFKEISTHNRTSTDGLTFTTRLAIGGSSQGTGDTLGRGISFTTTGAAVVKVYCLPSSDYDVAIDASKIRTVDVTAYGGDRATATSPEGSNSSSAVIEPIVFNLAAAGHYQVSFYGNSNLYYLTVTEGAAAPATSGTESGTPATSGTESGTPATSGTESGTTSGSASGTWIPEVTKLGYAYENYMLGRDIDLSSLSEGQLKMANANLVFEGIFDGQGYTIKNAVIDASADAEVIKTGLLIACLNGGTVRNVKFDNIAVTACKESVAIVIGTIGANGGDVEGIEITASGVTNAAGYSALLIGRLTTAFATDAVLNINNITIKNNCYVTCTSAKYGGYVVGDVIGGATVNMANCDIAGTLVSITDCAGYLIGRDRGSTLNFINIRVDANMTNGSKKFGLFGSGDKTSTVSAKNIIITGMVYTNTDTSGDPLKGNAKANYTFEDIYYVADNALVTIGQNAAVTTLADATAIAADELTQAWYLSFFEDYYVGEQLVVASEWEEDGDELVKLIGSTTNKQEGVITSIKIISNKAQSTFLAGEAYSSEGLVVKAVYSNGSEVEIPAVGEGSYTIDSTAFDTTAAGEYNIKISFGDFEEIYSVKVATVTGFIVYDEFAKSVYKVGEDLTLAGITVKAIRSDGVETKLTEGVGDSYFAVNTSAFDKTTAGVYNVVYTFRDYTAYNMAVTVVAAPASVAEDVSVSVDKAFTGVAGTIAAGKAQFATITEAIDYLTSCYANTTVNKYVYLAAGTYEEKITIPATLDNVSFIGTKDANGITTKIAYDCAAGYFKADGATWGTQGSSIVTVKGDAFQAVDVIFENTFPYIGTKLGDSQAVAIVTESDGAIFFNCEFWGHQDTLYAKTGRQYFVNCTIAGSVDFIFGNNATVLFDNCEIISRARGVNQSNGGYLTAHQGCSDQVGTGEVTYGYVFDGCTFTAEEGVLDASVSLGRPWRAKATVAYLNCTMGKHIATHGYDASFNGQCRYEDMSGNLPTAANFVEYNNSGDGAIAAEVAGMIMLSANEAADYTMANIFAATNKQVTWAAAWDAAAALAAFATAAGFSVAA